MSNWRTLVMFMTVHLPILNLVGCNPILDKVIPSHMSIFGVTLMHNISCQYDDILVLMKWIGAKISFVCLNNIKGRLK